jgi:hypothetical protein
MENIQESQEKIASNSTQIQVIPNNSNESPKDDLLMNALVNPSTTNMQMYISSQINPMEKSCESLQRFTKKVLENSLARITDLSYIKKVEEYFLQKKEYCNAEGKFSLAIEELKNDIFLVRNALIEIANKQKQASAIYENLLTVIRSWSKDAELFLSTKSNLGQSTLKDKIKPLLDQLEEISKSVKKASEVIKTLREKSYHKILTEEVFLVKMENTMSVDGSQEYLDLYKKLNIFEESLINAQMFKQEKEEMTNLFDFQIKEIEEKIKKIEELIGLNDEEKLICNENRNKSMQKLDEELIELENKRKELENDHQKKMNELHDDALGKSKEISNSMFNLKNEIEKMPNVNLSPHMVFIIDGSGSMSCRMESNTIFEAVRNCYNQIITSRTSPDSEDLVTTIIFDNQVTYSRSKVDIKTKPSLPDPRWGGTRYESGLNEALTVLRNSPKNKRPIIFFLTDGQNGGNNEEAKRIVKQIYSEFLQNGLVSFFLGVGSDNFNFLKELCEIANGGRTSIRIKEDCVDLFYNINYEKDFKTIFDNFMQVTDKNSMIKNKQKLLKQLDDALLQESQKQRNFLADSLLDSKKFLTNKKDGLSDNKEDICKYFDSRVTSLSKENEELEIVKNKLLTDKEMKIQKVLKISEEKKIKEKEIENLMEKVDELQIEVSKEKERCKSEREKSQKEMMNSIDNHFGFLKELGFNINETRLKNFSQAYLIYVDKLDSLETSVNDLDTFFNKINFIVKFLSNDITEKIKTDNRFSANTFFEFLIRYYSGKVFKNGELITHKDDENFKKILEYTLESSYQTEMKIAIDYLLKVFSPRELLEKTLSGKIEDLIDDIRIRLKKEKKLIEEEISSQEEEKTKLNRKEIAFPEKEEMENQIKKITKKIKQIEDGEKPSDEDSGNSEEEEDSKEKSKKKIKQLKKELETEIKKKEAEMEKLEEELEAQIQELSNSLKGTELRAKKKELETFYREDRQNILKEIEDLESKYEKKIEKEEVLFKDITKNAKENKKQKRMSLKGKFEELCELLNKKKIALSDLESKARIENENKVLKISSVIKELKKNENKLDDLPNDYKSILRRIYDLANFIRENTYRLLDKAMIKQTYYLINDVVVNQIDIYTESLLNVEALAPVEKLPAISC